MTHKNIVLGVCSTLKRLDKLCLFVNGTTDVYLHVQLFLSHVFQMEFKVYFVTSSQVKVF